MESRPLWRPLPGPQTEALNTEADITFYGGAAGGGKTDLLIGLALTVHNESVIYRREGTQLKGIYRRITDLVGHRDGFSQLNRTWKYQDKLIEFGSCPNLGDEQAYQGQPHDLIGFDEITHFLEAQFRFLIGWNRTTKEGQRCRVVCAGNPPTNSDGEWVKKYWGPWLDESHSNPAKPGELRWFATIDGKDTELENGETFEHDGDTITPQSRTFIPSKVQDNPYLMDTGYISTLQSLPEPLRSQMLKGDFTAGTDSDPWQVIPTDWVVKAQKRWKERDNKGHMDSIGLDVARGGQDETTIARRHDVWFDNLISVPGKMTPDGPSVAALTIQHLKNEAPIHIDVIGVGTSAYDHLKGTGVQVIAINGAEGTKERDKSGKLGFANQRARLYWRLREALDPDNGENVQLPPDSKLKADLTCPRWSLTARGVQVESKQDLIKRLGRSPDAGDAIVYANERTVKPKTLKPLKVNTKYVI